MKKFINKKRFGQSRGFTLVESMVAISILLIAVTGAFTVAQQGLQASYYARDRITAYYLAKEALEFVKNKRDENSLNGRTWLYGISLADSGQCGGTLETACGIDAVAGTIADCGTFNNCLLKQNASTGLYSYGSDPDSRFTRKVYIAEFFQHNIEAQVNVVVSWRSGVISKTLTITDNISNWLP